MSDIQEIIGKIDNLKPIPQVANRIMAIVQDPDGSLSELSEVLAYDQAITANVLKICNSAYFGLSRKIESVQHAVVFLGMDQIVDLVLMIAAAENFIREQKGYDLQEGDLWRYSVSSALIAKALAAKKGSKNDHNIFTSALLKDIGKVILNQYVDESFDRINKLVSEDGFSFREAEEKVIGIDHAELGGMVAESWKFSPRMIDTIRNHHMPNESSTDNFATSIVYVADTLCMMMGISGGSDALSYRFYRDVVDRLGFSERDFQEAIAAFTEDMQRVEGLIQIC
jgi:putative nucleotidyltransferase with HDIG domain